VIECPLGQEIIKRIKNGSCVGDPELDSLYPAFARDLSNTHWTPITIAKKAAAFTVKASGSKVLDVGSGVGKFCTVGALTTDGRFVGIEQRGALAEIADDIVNKFQIANVSFLNGNLDAVDWTTFDSIYLYNPFSENLDEKIRIDYTRLLEPQLYYAYVRYTQMQLDQMPSGSRVVIYNGFGGDLPPSYERTHIEEINFMKLEVWDKK